MISSITSISEISSGHCEFLDVAQYVLHFMIATGYNFFLFMAMMPDCDWTDCNSIIGLLLLTLVFPDKDKYNNIIANLFLKRFFTEPLTLYYSSHCIGRIFRFT